MPSLSTAAASNAAFSPSYAPVAVFVGGTSGVGQAMAEALARQTDGRAHIILVGRNAGAAARILAGFPKPTDSDEWKHEFVYCDATSMKGVRAVCDELKRRLQRINFLVLTASGPKANSMVECGETEEGLDNHLVMRYFARYLYTRDLLPLLVRAREEGQRAHVMTVLGAGLGFKVPTDDLGLVEARAASWKFLHGAVTSSAAMKGMMRGAAYNDGLVAWFGTKYPQIAFTHIYPGQVATEGKLFYPGWLLTPLSWIVAFMRHVIPQDECAQYMLHALLDAESERGGIYIRDNYGDVVGSHSFPADYQPNFSGDSSSSSAAAAKIGFLNGIPLKGYGGSDVAVARLMEYTEEVLSEI
ncbi:hypothetical protein R3P38DRAFT_2685703 [Favolaschia claudopus]|uniref:Uncharacterized protein n=1 Tax=Favolaschia claudopus TaxID=2862362 RepID=A0AAW0DR09_9AGAR